MKKLLALLVIFSAMLFTQTVLADSDCREGLNKMIQSLNLDESQKAKINPILQQFKQDVHNSGSQMKSLADQINQQVDSATMDQVKVDSLIDQKAKLVGDVMKAKIKAQSQILGILTAEQKEKLRDMIKSEDKKMEEKYKSCDQD